MPAPRFEFKYRIQNATALAIREYLQAFLEIDRHITNSETLSYPVDSIYLDSPELTTFWNTVHALKCRYKLRVRTYDDHPEAPVFFEIKRRIHDCIMKHRGIVHRSSVDSLLSGRMPSAEDMVSSDPEHTEAVERFIQLMLEIQATPRARVRYQREPWVSREDSSVRVTFDRDVFVSPAVDSSMTRQLGPDAARPFGDSVVLEIKFTGRAPAWLTELTQIGGLRRCSAAKYCDGVLTRGTEHFSPECPPPVDINRFAKAEARLNRLAAAPSFSGTASSFA
ncbi:MAG: polyphosphate polymerase domain-containing protein [Opitutaceae bacterium]